MRDAQGVSVHHASLTDQTSPSHPVDGDVIEPQHPHRIRPDPDPPGVGHRRADPLRVVGVVGVDRPLDLDVVKNGLRDPIERHAPPRLDVDPRLLDADLAVARDLDRYAPTLDR